MDRRLYRSNTDRMLGGVCGGLGQYLGIDPTLVRVFFVLLALANGIGVLIYLVMWVIVPLEGQGEATSDQTIRSGADEIAERARALGGNLGTSNQGAAVLIGAILIALGLIFLLQNLNIVWLQWLSFGILWPLLLIAAGLALIWRRAREE